LAEDQSFSDQVKEELAHLELGQSCCQLMELAALLRACGRISLGGAGRLAVTLTTDHAPVARRILRLIKSVFPLQTEVMVGRRTRLRKNLSYLVRLLSQPGLLGMLKATGVVDADGNLTDWRPLPLLQQDHCRRAYLRGTFLGTGWVAAPGRQHHLEMTTTETEAADALGQILFSYGIPVRMVYRKQAMVLYLKGADHIVRFLGLVGAHQALFHFEDVRAMKEMRNRVNRQVNAETANLDKTAEAAARQTEAVEKLRAGGVLERLSPALRELALLRVNHTEATLKELGEMCNPPVGKSGVNHRMRELLRLAETGDT
jgi:cell division protein WhiA